jgi:hypothetical protein
LYLEVAAAGLGGLGIADDAGGAECRLKRGRKG